MSARRPGQEGDRRIGRQVRQLGGAVLDLVDLNAQARVWVLQEAGVRVHGTTRKAPLALFETEKPLMRALPAISPDMGSWHRVSLHRDCHAVHARVLYSAPYPLVGKILWLRATDSSVTLYEDYRLVAAHRRGRRPGERITVRDHLPPNAAAFLTQDRDWCLAVLRVGARPVPSSSSGCWPATSWSGCAPPRT